MKQMLWALFWGLIIGGSLGFMEAAVSLGIWNAMGMPDNIFCRPNCLMDISFMEDVYTFGGIFAGLIFGGIIGAIARERCVYIRFFVLYLSLMLTGASFYLSLYYLGLRFRLPIWVVADIVLFALGIFFVRIFSYQPNDTKETQ